MEGNPDQVQQRERCDLCGSDSSEPFVKGRDLFLGTPKEFVYVKCKRCDLVFLQPLPVPSELVSSYPKEYYENSWKDRLSYNALLILERLTLGRSVPGPQASPVLDIGTGTGSFLEILKNRGSKAYGVEPYEPGYAAAKRRGLEVFHGFLTEAKLPDKFFGLVILNHVLEHVSKPSDLLQEIRRVLRPGGVLIVGIPNIDSFAFRAMRSDWFALDPPRHLFHFSPKTIKLYAEKSGLELTRIRYNSSALPFINFLHVVTSRALGLKVGLKGSGWDNAFLQAMFSPIAIMLNALRLGDKMEVFLTRPRET